MALESTAINDLIAGLQQRPLQRRDSDNWLFGEPEPSGRGDATEIDTSRDDKATTPFDRSTPLPGPPARQPASAIDYALHRPSSPTSYIRTTPNWRAIAKIAALPIGLFCIVIVLLGVYFAKSESKPTKFSAASEPAAKPVAVSVKVEAVEVPAPPPVAAPPPVVGAPEPAPTVTPIEEPKPEPKSETKPTVEAAPAVAAPAPEPAPAPEVANVEPGSPASRFLGTNAVQPTIPTVAVKPAPAPAPTVVANLPPPPRAASEPLGVEIAAKPVVKTKTAKKTIAQLRAEKRATSKRAAKATVAASKSRSRKQVAAAADDTQHEAEEAKPTAKPTGKGKGVLSIASTPAMEVWVDGRNSKAETPVRIILLAGKHKVSLFDTETKKARSFDVEIKPDETTKVVKSY